MKVGDKLLCVRTIKYDDKDDFIQYGNYIGKDKIIFGKYYKITYINDWKVIIKGEKHDVHFRKDLIYVGYDIIFKQYVW